ncbi:MAG: sugar phosphate isomerase/epimerase [Gemmatimonadales bacterium]|nr:sugar phosphate isomerase/epimerase [Gemmatimonadales bacterium]
MRPVTLFTGQWADMPLETLAAKASGWGYDGLELACWGDHFDVRRALTEKRYVKDRWMLLKDHGLHCFAISNHLTGQAVCDRIDARHKAIVPEHVWGDGDAEGVRRRAALEMIDTAKAARRFFDAAPAPVKKHLARTGRTVVNGFTGSSIWSRIYSFPPNLPGEIDAGFADFGARWRSILNAFQRERVHFALEVHPAEIAFDIASARRALAAVKNHRHFGFNFDPSHFGYQGVDYLRFLREFGGRIFHTHVKDVWWSSVPTEAGTFGGHTEFGAPERNWDFRTPGRGRIDFDAIMRTLNQIGYAGPLSVEWEDPHMDREHGAAEASWFVKKTDFPAAGSMFDSAFAKKAKRVTSS